MRQVKMQTKSRFVGELKRILFTIRKSYDLKILYAHEHQKQNIFIKQENSIYTFLVEQLYITGVFKITRSLLLIRKIQISFQLIWVAKIMLWHTGAIINLQKLKSIIFN